MYVFARPYDGCGYILVGNVLQVNRKRWVYVEDAFAVYVFLPCQKSIGYSCPGSIEYIRSIEELNLSFLESTSTEIAYLPYTFMYLFFTDKGHEMITIFKLQCHIRFILPF